MAIPSEGRCQIVSSGKATRPSRFTQWRRSFNEILTRARSRARHLSRRGRKAHDFGVNDPHDLQRFIDAQEPIYETALGEICAGSKRSHWMWFIFPQLRGLGLSHTAHFY